jgi:TonB-dependent starch-binding outer membrane protein SusC
MYFKNLLKVCCLILLCFFVIPAMAQNKTISGKITDSKDGSPLIGASVVAKGSTAGSITDINGAFKLSAPSSTNTLVISYIGYITKEVPASSDVVNVALESNSSTLNEVLVVGYGTVRKKDATGAVVKVTSADFVQGVTTDPLQQLQGKVSGVVIASTSGDPTATATVRIRGTASISGGNDPLYVIDGVAGADPHALSPNDIESFDVLKDASAAAIYGSRAAGGVILITTKTGKAGKPQISYNSYVGTESAENLPQFANSSQYLALIQQSGNPTLKVGTDPGDNQGANTNWFDAITRTGITQSQNLALSGGSEKSHYRASMTYIDQQGVALKSENRNLNARFNFDQKALDDKLTITMNFQGTHSMQNYTDSIAFFYASFVPPVYTIYDPKGSGNYNYINNTDEFNPLPFINNITNTGVVDKLSGNLRLDYALAKGLTISPYVYGVSGSSSTNLYLPPSTLWDGGNTVDRLGYLLGTTKETGELISDGDVDKTSSTETVLTYGATVNYKLNFGKNRLSLLGGYEGNQFSNTGTRVAGHDFNEINLPSENINAANVVAHGVDVGSFDNGYKLDSWFGRAELNFLDKYYITGNVRYDWSEKLGFNNQSGVFPSVNGAWVITNEDFMKSQTLFSSLKLRGGYGQVGNQGAISPYNSQLLFGPVQGKPYYDGASGNYLTSNFSIQNQNPNLRWEVKSTTDVAVDFSIFNGRLSGSFDWYSSTTNNLLYPYTVAPGGQFFVTTILANIGSMTNKGIDLSLNGIIVKTRDFSWNAGLNVSLNRNKITNLSGSFDNTQFSVTQANVGTVTGLGISGAISQVGYLKVGYPIGTLLLPQYAGQNAKGAQLFYYKNTTTGQRDTTSNINLLNTADNGSGDRGFYTTDPKFTYGFSTNLNYKQFDLNIFLRGQYGSHAFNQNDMNFTSLQKAGTYALLASAAGDNITSASEPSTLWLESTSFLKVQNVTLGYTIKINGDNRYIDRLHVYVAGNNLYTFTPYKGIDPEITTANGQASANGIVNTPGDAGIDQAISYPRAREVSVGVNIILK